MSKPNHTECLSAIVPVQDALNVLSGKWKLPILISVSSGNNRFKLIERSIPKITSKVLSNELKDLEEHQLIKRTVTDTYPVTINYTVTSYFPTLGPILKALKEWGENHRKRIMGKD